MVSPAAGVVTHRFVEPGTAVSSGDPLHVVADVRTLVVRVGVSDVHARQLSPGRQASITLDGETDRTRRATIRRVFPAADPGSRLRTVEFVLHDGPGQRRPAPGSHARVDVSLEERPGVLAVPNEALLASTPDEPFVFVIEGDRLVRRPVVTGVSRRDWTEMREGLKAGELVVASNPAQLREGMRVRVTQRVAQPGEPS